MRTAIALVALAAVLPPLAPRSTPQPAQTRPAVSWEALVNRIEAAAIAGRSDQLRSARIDALTLLASAPGEREVLLRYAVAYAGWRMAVLPDVPKNEGAGMLEDGVEHLKAALKKDERFAEGHALLGGIYGLQIGTSAWKGMTLGPRASSALDNAASLEPENPRVLLQQGVSALHTPPMFGGGVAKAEPILRRSLDRFAREPLDKPWPNWGRTDAHAWLGQTLQKRGDANGARTEYEAALAIAPEFSWVRYVLLPGLDRKR